MMSESAFFLSFVHPVFLSVVLFLCQGGPTFWHTCMWHRTMPLGLHGPTVFPPWLLQLFLSFSLSFGLSFVRSFCFFARAGPLLGGTAPHHETRTAQLFSLPGTQCLAPLGSPCVHNSGN